MQKDWIVYWLFDAACFCPWRHGYIGATNRLPQRMHQHRTSGHWSDFGSQKLFRGPKDAALALEGRLRPTPGIGWNVGVGGFGDGRGTRGIPKSAEHRERQRAAALKRYRDPAEHERTSRAVKKGLKGIDRTGSNNHRFGVRVSEATKEKIRQRALARDTRGANNPNYRHGGYVED